MSLTKEILIIVVVIVIETLLIATATAETIIVPKAPAGSGYRIIEEGNYPLDDKPAYEWVKVWKTKEEIREEVYQRKITIRQNRWIKAQNRAGQFRYIRGRWKRIYLPIQRLKPLRKYRWVRVRIR